MRTGVVEWRANNTVHLVSYFRYFRFLPDGTFIYRTSPLVISKVVKSLTTHVRLHGEAKVSNKAGRDEQVHSGRYAIKVCGVLWVCAGEKGSACALS